MELPNMQFAASEAYRYGFNGKENDKETNTLDFGARHYDSRIARWWSVDPLFSKYAGHTPYNFVLNDPIRKVDPDGEDGIIIVSGNTITIKSTIYISGTKATEQKAKEIQAQIMAKDKFGGNFKYKNYTVKFDIEVKVNENVWANMITPGANFIDLEDKIGTENRSHVSNGRYGKWLNLQTGADGSAHETGHLLGFGDEYGEIRYRPLEYYDKNNNFISAGNYLSLSELNFGETFPLPMTFNDKNTSLMYDPKGVLQQRHINALAEFALKETNGKDGMVFLDASKIKLNPTSENDKKYTQNRAKLPPQNARKPQKGSQFEKTGYYATPGFVERPK